MKTEAFTPVPDSLLDPAGVAAQGRFRGPLRVVDLRQRARRRPLDALRHKRWMYVAVATREHLCTAAIVDAGYAANAFAFVAARQGGMLAEVSALSLPRLLARVGDRPEAGCDAWFRAPALRVDLTRPSEHDPYRLRVEAAELHVDVRLSPAEAPTPIAAVADLEHLGGGLNVTAKRVLMPVSGEVRVHGQPIELGAALGGFDYTQGYLPRHTVWKWAFLIGNATDGTRVGLNLVQGFNGQIECALWCGDELIPVAEGLFDRHPDPRAPWRVRTACGTVDLQFDPFGVHSEYRNLLIVRSRFLQVMGSFSGHIRRSASGRGADLVLDGVLGVTEDQDLLW
jgi:hypothetical protein